jgi:hypothetical protein
MMNAYDALLRAAQTSRARPQAIPVHHILEEKPRPTPQNPQATVVVGSNLRNEMVSKLEEFEARASDPSLPFTERHQYQQAINHLKRMIADEDAYHATQKEREAGAMAGADVADLEAARARARAGVQGSDMRGLSLEEAMRKGWRPPSPQGR